MYVIYPAEEIISLTYGVAAAVQRPILQRPTLDNLREPLVLVGSSSLNPISIPSQLPTANNQIQNQRKSTTESIERFVDYKQNLNIETNELGKPLTLNNLQDNHSTQNNLPTHPSLGANTNTTIITTEKPPQPPLKGKSPKSKLQLKFAKIGRPHSSPDPIESTRILEYHDIHVSNPTFTRDNLRHRNFDAFFESGEPVYSIETKEKTTSSNISPVEELYETSNPVKPQKSKINFLKRNKPPIISPQQKQISEINQNRRYSRTSDIILIVEEPQKETTKARHNKIFGSKAANTAALDQSYKDMASASGGGILKDLGHPGLNDTLKSHNSVTFKLVKTVSDFTETLAQIYEQHAEALQLLASSYRKKNGELRKERPACQSSLFYSWEVFLQEVEADSQANSEISNTLSRQVSRPLLERSFHRKIQSRKVFTHRESFDTIIAKTEEKLSKCRIDYKQSYSVHRQNPTQHSLQQYVDAHNAYVQQLHATNAMLEAYHCETVPQLLLELEQIYDDLCNIMSEAVLQGAEAISAKASDQAKRYDNLVGHCKNITGIQDLTNFARSIQLPVNALRVPKKAFAPPQPIANVAGETDDSTDYADGNVPIFKNELVLERGGALTLRPSLEQLKREAIELETQIRQLQDSVDVLVRTQLRGLEGQLYNKANELQEDISMKKFDLRAKEIHLAAVQAQKELFQKKVEPGSPVGSSERKLSTSSSSSMKTKWMNAFRSLKPASSSSATAEKSNQMYFAVSTVLSMRKNGTATGNSQMSRMGDTTDNHNLQEYTYKKITPCDVCSQVLRGHQRQGLRCRMCKTNVHVECVPQLGKCSVKAKLLRRQKSTSEIENRVEIDEETPHSPRRQKLNLRMKSLSLDSPESTELHGQMRRRYPGPGPSTYYGGSGGGIDHTTPPSNNTPSSPSQPQRKLLYANRGIKSGSVDLPDDVEKSLSSASTSPCPSPVRQSGKSHRLLPTNLYVVLYNFKARHQDELDLKAGYKVTVIDTSDPDWWKGKCLGRIGYFPSKYVLKLAAGEKVLQVTHNIQVADIERGDKITLLRDQIIGEEINGMIKVRGADKRLGICPSKYLQEDKNGNLLSRSKSFSVRKHQSYHHNNSIKDNMNKNNYKNYLPDIKPSHYHREHKRNPHLSDIDHYWDRYEKFRERKMAMMRAHKQNVEQKLKAERHFSRQQSTDKNLLLQPIHKDIVKHEGRRTSLDSNWYTENIYSNQSVDNSDDDKIRKKFHFCHLDLNGNDDESDDLFIINFKPRKDSPSKSNATPSTRYPKSNSCCFCTQSPDHPLFSNISKSHSFSTARGYKFPTAEMSELYNTPRKLRVNTQNTNLLFNEDSLNEYSRNSRHGRKNNEKSNQKIENNYIDYNTINEWELKSKSTASINHNEIYNDTDIFSYDSDVASESQDLGASAVHDNGLNQLFKTERSKIMLRDKFDKLNKYTDDFMDDYNKSFDDILRVTEYTLPNKNNIRLAIKPSKYDDSSSDISTDTDLELDDFNFDFEKYWMDLEKNKDLDINRNTLSKKNILKSTKNVNVERYNTTDSLKRNLNEIGGYDELNQKLVLSGINNESYVKTDETLGDPALAEYRDSIGRNHRFSLLNNIFSIYKPNKYSHLNCQQSLIEKNNRIKSLKLTKKINRSSALRPLGETLTRSRNQNPVFMSSCNRPLMIASSPPFLPSPHPTRDQARFQIIPEKTGLKISPLYRLDYEHGLNNRKHKYSYLKSTTRPLTFW
uniref:CSON012985 protein n=1 Tax=Culicoides sonorensis TaxID=179676 RepID=A0A336K301_CULSO